MEDNIKRISIASEMKKSFLDYAMSVIVSRALPDVKDGLKPVHRRIIYSMNEVGMYNDKPYKKSARIVGEVMGKYHPHGDSSIYDAMVRLAQDFSTRYMLVQGHGNFGSIDGDGPAAMRYTEARMSKICMQMVRDIKKDTVDYQDNYDATEKEPVVLPSRIPNILINGSTGIAVGMATNIAPHNLGEVIDGIIAYLDNHEITSEELMQFIKGPDFPTGAIILGSNGIKESYVSSRGSIAIRSKTEVVELKNGKHNIIITEIPYQVQKSRLISKIADLVRDKKLDGISDLRDESNRDGIKIVIELKKETNPSITLNNLFKHTQLQVNFNVNTLALVDNEPKLLTLRDIVHYYVLHQRDIIVRRTTFDLNKAKSRVHILEGLVIAIDNIDLVIEIIRSSQNDLEIIGKLTTKFDLSQIQAKAILEMQLRRLSGLERTKLTNEVNELYTQIAALEAILASDDKVDEIIKLELIENKKLFGDERRTAIDNNAIEYIEDESLIPRQDITIILTKNGYVKRTLSNEYRVQNRGGVGVKGIKTNEDDFVEILLNASTHDYILFFTNYGKVYRIKGYEVPNYSRVAKGLPIVNLLPLDANEKVNTIIPIKEFNEADYLTFATKSGYIKRTLLKEFASIRITGKKAITLNDGDELIAVKHTNGSDGIILGASNGKAILFEEEQVRASGRTSRGVRGINLGTEELCVGMSIAYDDIFVLVVSSNGYGKLTPIEKYRYQTRGGKGSKTIKSSLKNGDLVALRTVNGNEDIIITSNEGMLIRINTGQISVTGRDTVGVKVINLKEKETVSNVAIVSTEDEELLA